MEQDRRMDLRDHDGPLRVDTDELDRCHLSQRHRLYIRIMESVQTTVLKKMERSKHESK